MINTQIRQLQDDLLMILNNSPIPMEAKRIVLANLCCLTEKQADNIIREELEGEKNAESI